MIFYSSVAILEFFKTAYSPPSYSDSSMLSFPLSVSRYLTTTESSFVSPTSERNVTPSNNVVTTVSLRYKSCFLSNKITLTSALIELHKHDAINLIVY